MVNYVGEGRMDITILPGQTLDDAMKISETNPITEANIEKADFGHCDLTREEIQAILDSVTEADLINGRVNDLEKIIY
ncbi:MAG: hypothetical protein PHG82_01640 [Candidatus Gracilibacteria bacterium]|nr:hypothetical protein [Candidatus Gracilibacteria bacterium]